MSVFNFVTVFALLALCSGFVIISGSSVDLFPVNEKRIYQWDSSVNLRESDENAKKVGVHLTGKVIVSSIWSEGEEKLLKLELSLSTHETTLENQPFYILLRKGVIEKLLIEKDENQSLRNIKKGIASVFQFYPDHAESVEHDSSGQCNVLYTKINSHTIEKVKTSCEHVDLNSFKHLDPLLGLNTTSNRVIKYTIDDSGLFFNTIQSEETHFVAMQSNEYLGSVITATQSLTHSQQFSSKTPDNIDNILRQLSSEEAKLTTFENNKESHKVFGKEVGTFRSSLKQNQLGKLKSAAAFLQLLDAAKQGSSEDISKALGTKKNENILPQLYDVLGYAQTESSHAAVMKHLHLDDDKHTDLVERYLWALSFSVHPNVQILEDLLKKYKTYSNIPEKVRHTLVLTIAAMSRNLLKYHTKHEHSVLKVIKTVEETIVNGLDYAKDADRYVFLNALRNLQSSSTLAKLTDTIRTGTPKEEVLAWRAIKSFGKKFWTVDLLKQAEKTVFQLDKMHDTSSRTLAVDLLLEAGVDDATLKNLLFFVSSNATNYEVKQYVFQSIKMLAEDCPQFHQRVMDIIKSNNRLNNYSSLSPRGLSTALKRDAFKSNAVNGSLVSIQEIKSGIVKRGVVDVVLTKKDQSKSLFTLGIFAGGLSSFVASDEEEEADDDTATAGMELTVLGTQIRPFVFFEGQGELMGHVWSGTASDMTPAFQALILVQDHTDVLRLGNGFLVDLDFKGAVSFDLSGKIELSLWNRNAKSLIKKSVGFISRGIVAVSTSLGQCQLKFEASNEPELNLEIDSDFSGKVLLCMRLSQPDSVFRYGGSKSDSSSGNTSLSLSYERRKTIPGFTYALNRKNSEMCSAIFS